MTQKVFLLKNMKKLVLIDGNALVHRAYHALPKLTTKKGELVNAVYGFTSILLKVLNDLRPDYVAATFDLAGPTFRHEEFKDYKATRVKAPQELYNQLNRVKQVLVALNIPIYEWQGFEADDVIGTLARQAGQEKKEDVETIIVTGDLDTLQLVNDKVKVYTLKKGINDTILYDEKAVRDRYGLSPEQMPDFKGLKGDPSDNIPGVPGVGDKTAAELLKEYNTIENLYENLGLLPQKIGNKLEEYKEQAAFSKYLATIKTDVPVELDLAKCELRDYNPEIVKRLFEELEFFSLLKRLPSNEKKD
jgi:DNA polymerase-1